MSKIPTDKQMHEMQKTLNEMRQLHWKYSEFLTFQWWLLLIVMVIPWMIWWKFVDKKRIHEILLYGFFVIMLSIILDDIGSHVQLWDYNRNLTPFVHQLSPINLSILPVSFMLIYQYFQTTKSFVIAHIILAAGGSFIVEPLFEKMNIYVQYDWKHIYSFPIYILMALFLNWLINKINNQNH